MWYIQVASQCECNNEWNNFMHFDLYTTCTIYTKNTTKTDRKAIVPVEIISNKHTKSKIQTICGIGLNNTFIEFLNNRNNATECRILGRIYSQWNNCQMHEMQFTSKKNCPAFLSTIALHLSLRLQCNFFKEKTNQKFIRRKNCLAIYSAALSLFQNFHWFSKNWLKATLFPYIK